MSTTTYKDALNNSVLYKDITLSDNSKLPQSSPSDASGNVLFSDTNPGVVKSKNGVVLGQTFVPTVAFNTNDASGTGGSNGTIVPVLPANPNRAFLEIINNGNADAELWFTTKPPNSDVGLTIKKGVVIQPGAGRVYDTRVPTNAIFVTTSLAGGLSVLEG